MNLKHNQRTPKGVITWFEMGQEMTKLKRSNGALELCTESEYTGTSVSKLSRTLDINVTKQDSGHNTYKAKYRYNGILVTVRTSFGLRQCSGKT